MAIAIWSVERLNDITARTLAVSMVRTGMRSPADHDLIERLDDIVTRALAVTMGDPLAAIVDENALLAELSAATDEIVSRAGEMVPGLDRLTGALQTALASAPDPSKRAAHKYTISMLKWQPDPPAMPREASAFVVCDRLRSARERCRYQLANASYEALRAPGDPCDCAAKISASFFVHRPTGPLILLDSAGVPYSAMDYLWQCRSCGRKWFEHEVNDDMGAHSSWELAPTAASKA